MRNRECTTFRAEYKKQRKANMSRKTEQTCSDYEYEYVDWVHMLGACRIFPGVETKHLR